MIYSGNKKVKQTMVETIVTPRGCPTDVYVFELMKEFEASRDKYEPLNGHYVTVFRDTPNSPITVSKTLDEETRCKSTVYHTYIPYCDDIPEHQAKDFKNCNFDQSIEAEYLGDKTINLQIEEGDVAFIGRKLTGELYVMLKKNVFDCEMYNFMFRNKAPKYLRHEPYSSCINSDGDFKINLLL